MKLRILNDSIRLRLDRQEVERLGAGGTVRCATRFPAGAPFGYELGAGGEAVSAAFVDGVMRISVPVTALAAWAGDDTRVGIRESLPLDAGELTVLVEKDFECLEPRPGESQSNRFRNPKAES